MLQQHRSLGAAPIWPVSKRGRAVGLVGLKENLTPRPCCPRILILPVNATAHKPMLRHTRMLTHIAIRPHLRTPGS